jgi:hypothetical protein
LLFPECRGCVQKIATLKAKETFGQRCQTSLARWLFSNQKSQILEGLSLDNGDKFYFMDIWNILRTFGIFYDQWIHFVLIWFIFPVLVSCIKLIWQSCARPVNALYLVGKTTCLTNFVPKSFITSVRPKMDLFIET